MKAAPIRRDDEMIGSASVTALMRYLLSNESGLAKNPDNLGKYFVSGKWKDYLNDPKSSIKEFQKKLPGCIYYHLIRTKFFDNAVNEWCESVKDSQIIILGSGFDSRSIRFEKMLKQNNVTVFEVDLPAMLAHKKEIIKKEIR